MSGQWKRWRNRPAIGSNQGLFPEEIEDFYARIDRIRKRVMRNEPWRHVPGWNGKDPVTLRSI